MRKLQLIIFLALSASALNAAEYQSDWNYKNFYEAVNTCRSAIVFPAATDYEKRGLASKQSKETLRNEMIALTPASESIATEACYCAVNEYAKDKLNVDFVKNWEGIAQYMETPRCKAKMTDAMKAMKQNGRALLLK